METSVPMAGSPSTSYYSPTRSNNRMTATSALYSQQLAGSLQSATDSLRGLPDDELSLILSKISQASNSLLTQVRVMISAVSSSAYPAFLVFIGCR
jgi:hypothetical protein